MTLVPVRAEVASGTVASRTVSGLGLCLAVLIATSARWGADWPAQEFRAWSAQHDGLSAWTNRWYGGQPLPGYSVFYPIVSSVLSAGATGVVAVLAATLGARRFAPRGSATRHLGYLASVAFVLCADLLIGQVPYLVGTAFGVWAVDAASRRRTLAAAVLAAGCSLASPLAGLFLLICAPALACVWGWRRIASLTPAVLGLAVSSLVGGGSGPFPFAPRVLLWTAAFAALAMVLPLGRAWPVRVLGATLAAATIATLAVPNPIGGNLARLGQLLALPLLWHAWPDVRWPRRALAVPLCALAVLWSAWPAGGSLQSVADASTKQSYYAGLLRFLRTQDPRRGRLEYVFTHNHWESLFVARAFPIARGWERQTDLLDNQQLYHPLTSRSYRQWLDEDAVSLVALSTAPIDYGGRAEAALLRTPPSYLRLVWHDRNIRVWRVQEARPLLTGPARLEALGPASMTIRFTGAGTATIRVHGSSLWSVRGPHGCVATDRRGWLTVTAARRETLELEATVNLSTFTGQRAC